VSFIKLTVVDLNNIWQNDQLKKSGESISPKVAAESLHDPDELGYFQERVRRKLMNLHKKASRIVGRIGSQRNLSPQVKKSWNTTTSPSSGVGVCSSSGARLVPAGNNPAAS
jgi:hypothetical protein